PLTAIEVKREAERLGFAACGVATLEPLPHAEVLDRWLQAGYAGNMRYLHRQARKRKDPRLADREAVRAVVVLDNYYYADAEAEPPPAPRIARYARGEDYHRVTLRRLEQLADLLRRSGARTARPYVDTGPVAERELAQRAGLGWIGKNTMLLRPEAGSWFFIGSVLTDLALEPDRPFTADHCGSCTRCLDACPTGAFVEPHVLDASRCISYLTIEHKGLIPEALADRFDGWAFGCDRCNEVCPWNQRFATESTVPEFRPRGVPSGTDPGWFDRMDPEQFERSFGDTPLSRPGLERMRRNWRAAWRSRR
ncbi:MAG TPA: tRNA epoxyqueuosine(34) reductase QueG, partial [Gemmatimonadales bacterium]|nr:tRNA epoxyqueuosine(34) reductase QueG [Gemmatimonadales bacterium]